MFGEYGGWIQSSNLFGAGSSSHQRHQDLLWYRDEMQKAEDDFQNAIFRSLSLKEVNIFQ